MYCLIIYVGYPSKLVNNNIHITSFPGPSSSNDWSIGQYKELIPLPGLGTTPKDHPSFRFPHGDG